MVDLVKFLNNTHCINCKHFSEVGAQGPATYFCPVNNYVGMSKNLTFDINDAQNNKQCVNFDKFEKVRDISINRSAFHA